MCADPSVEKLGNDLAASPDAVENPYLPMTPWGWTIDPEGLRYVLNQYYERYELPLFIVENGFGYEDTVDGGQIHDNNRIKYLDNHIREMIKAIEEDGVDVIGYTVWGCIDPVSFTTGEMRKRYGFIYVDKMDDGSGTYARSKKVSGRYKKEWTYFLKKTDSTHIFVSLYYIPPFLFQGLLPLLFSHTISSGSSRVSFMPNRLFEK